MVIFVIVMVTIALLAAVGFLISNRSDQARKPRDFAKSSKPSVPFNPAVSTQPRPQPQLQASAQVPGVCNEDILTYVAAEIPSILHEVLSSVPLATLDEAMMGCYGTMGAGTQAGAKAHVKPYQTDSVDELVVRAAQTIDSMEAEQHISKFTISTQKKSKANPHVDLFAHSTEPKRIRLIRFWRTQEGFVSTLPS
jgi:hypothetical protein